MRIGILGGTFDPPHIGHLVIADQTYTQLHLDQVWFAPVGQPPHKRDRRVSAAQHRIAMTRLAIHDNPHFDLSLLDVDRPPPHYITTLFEMLTQQHLGCEWYLIMGGDSLMELPNWYQPQRLIQMVHFAVAHRPGYQPDLEQLERALPGLSAKVEWVDSPMIDLASSDLQRRARQGLPLRYVVTREVADYLDEHSLYGAPELGSRGAGEQGS
jgi:nicotinate-nucleotide adenylyltransferase